MSVVTITCQIDLDGLDKFKDLLPRGGHPSTNEHINDCLKLWTRRYLAWIQKRYDSFSKSEGDWPPLAPSTIAARRHGAGGHYKRGKRALQAAIDTGGGDVSILRDTGTLFHALDPVFSNQPGALNQFVDGGIEVGFGGPALHPNGNATIADIATFHQLGGRNLPQRQIIVDPNESAYAGASELLNAMREDAIRAMNRIVAEDAAREALEDEAPKVEAEDFLLDTMFLL